MGHTGNLARLWMVAVTNERGLVRRIHMHDKPPTRTSVYTDVAEGCVAQGVGLMVGRPHTVIVDQPELVGILDELLAGSDIAAGLGDTSAAREAIEQASMSLGSEVPTWLAHAPAEEAMAFMKAWDRFVDAETWDVFPPYERIAFRVGNDPWHYATLMGHGGEEFGIAVLPKWSSMDAIGNPEDDVEVYDRLDATGHFESISLSEIGLASPLDAPLYMDAFGATNAEDDVPLCLAYESSGPVAPRYGPAVYTALLNLLVKRARRVVIKVRKIDATLETSAGPVRVRYPATGYEVIDDSRGPTGQA